MQNRHLVDALAAVREERHRLSAREEALRLQLLVPRADLLGDDYQAHVHTFERRELDRALLKIHLSEAVIANCERIITYKVVALSKRARTQKAPTTEDEAVEVAP